MEPDSAKEALGSTASGQTRRRASIKHLVKKRWTPVPTAHKELCDLCREGRLFAVQDWFKRNTYAPPAKLHPRQLPMRIAIDAGFHSLVEVLLQNGVPADAAALTMALRKRRTDFVDLLFQYGANARTVTFDEVIETANPAVIQRFIDLGADLYAGYPIARGLVRATRPFLAIYKGAIEKHPQLQFQADMALRHFADAGSLRGVCLLMWLGANPRAKVPLPEEPRDSEYWSTSMEDAALHGNLEIIKRLKPDPAKDNVHELLADSLHRFDSLLLHFWLSLGADINRTNERGEPFLHEQLMHHVEWATSKHGTPALYNRAYYSKDFLIEWFSLGAKWQPSGDSVRCIRKCLSNMWSKDALSLIKIFKEREVFPLSTLPHLLNHPKLRAHLEPVKARVVKLVPQLARWLMKAPGQGASTPTPHVPTTTPTISAAAPRKYPPPKWYQK